MHMYACTSMGKCTIRKTYWQCVQMYACVHIQEYENEHCTHIANLLKQIHTWTLRFLLFSRKHLYIRKMMSSATITWLSSCMRARAARTSVSLNGDGQLLLMLSIRAIMPTDWAWAERNTSSSAVLNSFNLQQKHTLCIRHSTSETISGHASDAVSV